MDVDDHLTQLLQSMSLAGSWNSFVSCVLLLFALSYTDNFGIWRQASSEPQAHLTAHKEQDFSMSDSSDSEDSTYSVCSSVVLLNELPVHAYPSRFQPSPSTLPKSPEPAPTYCGCGLLQAVQDQLDSDLFPTTSGDYLDLIFAHREAFFAFPQNHRDCAIGFSEIAKKVETRKWRADREGDVEAMNAFRNEAWVVANAF